MLSLTSVSASEVVVGDVADEFRPPCQRVDAMTVTVYMAAGSRTGVAGSQANRLDHSATTHHIFSIFNLLSIYIHFKTFKCMIIFDVFVIELFLILKHT